MTKATLTRLTHPRTASLDAITMALAGNDLGSPPGEALRGVSETSTRFAPPAPLQESGSLHVGAFGLWVPHRRQ